MRVEKRYLAYGHDLDTDISPIQAGLAFAVGWDRPFIGREALLRQREAAEACRIVTLLLEDEDAVPLGGEPVYLEDRIAGKTTSAAFGYRIGRPLAIADLTLAEARAEGATAFVDIAGTRHAAKVTLRPAFDPQGLRMRGLQAAVKA